MEPEKKSNGALVGLIVIIIILIVGGVYIWQTNKEKLKMETNPQSKTVTNEDAAELNTLEADVSATDTNTGVDASTVK